MPAPMADEAPPDGSSTLRGSLQCCNGGMGHPCISETESPPRSPPARDPSADQTSRSQTVQEEDTNSRDSADHSASQQISESQYYTHKDYAHTFLSKKEAQHFLDTGEVIKGKGLLQKKWADGSSGESSGSRRSTKRTMLLPANNDPPKRPTAYADYLRRPIVGGMFRYLPKDQWPPGFL